MVDTSEVILFNPNEITAFNAFGNQLDKLESDNSKAVFDYEDPKGNKDARSHVYKLRQTKSAVEVVRKETKDSALKYGKAVDKQAAEIALRIEGMIAVHEKPLKEVKEREEKRVLALKERLANITLFIPHELTTTATELEQIVLNAEAIKIDDNWKEFKTDAVYLKDKVLIELKQRLTDRQKFESDQAELKKLREEKEAREATEKAERLENERLASEKRIREEAAEQARIEAENKAKAKLDKVKCEKQEALDREKKLKDEAKQAKLDKIEADKQANINIENARLAEIKRQKDKKDQEQADLEKREADKRHVNSVMKEAEDAVVEATGLNSTQAKAVITSIYNKDIPAVTISF